MSPGADGPPGAGDELRDLIADIAATHTEPPADEPAAPSKRAKSADATGRGARHEKKWAEVERVFGGE